jgi:tetratricopeptide (TPR) repeat protein
MIGSFVALALLAGQKLAMNVNLKDGDVISGEKKFVVSVQSKNPVTQVELYVGSESPRIDTSVPYEFTLDTLGEDDGDLKITFKAYTTEGENISKAITVKIDNGVGKGVDFHLNNAKEALTNSNWDDAIASARLALKADAKSSMGKLYLARGYFGKGVLDKAQINAEDAASLDPKNTEALDMIAAINLTRVFSTINRGGDVKDTNTVIQDGLKAAVEARRKVLDMQLDSFGEVNDSNRIAYVDLALKAGRYSTAIGQLAQPFRVDPKNNAIADRLIYAYLRANRFADAREALDNVRRYGSFDAYGNGLDAVLQTELGNSQKADDALREGILNDPDDLGVKSAQAYIALKRGRTDVLQQLAKSLTQNESQRTEVNYFASALYNRLQDYPTARKYLQRSLLAEPTNYDMYIEAANQVLGGAVRGTMDKKSAEASVAYAKSLYEAALLANDSSSPALVGITLANLYQGNNADALKYGEAAVKAAPQYAAAHYAYSAAATANATGSNPMANQLRDLAQSENAKAGKIDAVNLAGRELPKVQQAWIYFSTGGRAVVLVPPGK